MSPIDKQRRRILSQFISASTVSAVMASGLVLPNRVLAQWSSDAFAAQHIEDILLILMGKVESKSDPRMGFEADKPSRAITDGRSVMISINCELIDIERLALIVDSYQQPLVMYLDVTTNVLFPFKTRIELPRGKSQLIAIARAEGEIYQATRIVQVQSGGLI